MQAVALRMVMCRSCPSGAASAFRLVRWDERAMVEEGWDAGEGTGLSWMVASRLPVTTRGAVQDK